MMDKQIIELSIRLGQSLKEKELKIVTAESCTGGGIAQAITEIPGSSVWFDRGFVTYSNLSKIQMLGVKQSTLEQYGAVSEQVAIEMVAGALLNSDADLAVAVTGVAGPGGGSVLKPVGTVYIAWGRKRKLFFNKFLFTGDRAEIRKQVIITSLNGLLNKM
jgi:nicotinamide-nucleotide amidase